MKLNQSFAWFGMYLVKQSTGQALCLILPLLLVLFLMEMKTHYAC